MKLKKHLIIKILFLISIIFIIAAKQSPMTIEADTLNVEANKNKATFSGHVKVRHEDSKIDADKMIIFYNKENKPEHVDCEGNVKFAKEDMYGFSNKAKVDLNKNIVRLIGDVKVWQGENYLEGEEVIIYNDTKEVKVVPKKGGRVKLIFIPEDKGNSIGNKDNKSKKNIQ
jgi:lipopolysaccharide export system protein LptA